MNTSLPLEPLGAPAPARKSRPRMHVVLDQVTIYLPILLMALLAGASYWLLRATPMPVVPLEQRAPEHIPDYEMERFSVKLFGADGRIRTEVYGAEGRHYPDTDTLEIDKARIRHYSPEGLLTTATAERVTSNGDQTEFILEGNAVVVRQAGKNAEGKRTPRLEFHGEYLRILTRWDIVGSDRPVLLIRDNDQMRADTLYYRGDRQTAVLRGRVQAQMQAR